MRNSRASNRMMNTYNFMYETVGNRSYERSDSDNSVKVCSRESIMIRWFMIGFLIVLLFSGAVMCLYTLFKYEPHLKVYGICGIAIVFCFYARWIIQAAKVLVQDSNAADLARLLRSCQ